MHEDKKIFSPGFPAIDPKIIELFQRLESNRSEKENHELEEILGELKIGHKDEAKKLLTYYKAKKVIIVESKAKLADDLKTIQSEIETTKRILEKPEYQKQGDVYKEMLGKFENEQKELHDKIKQAKRAADDLIDISELEEKLKE